MAMAGQVAVIAWLAFDPIGAFAVAAPVAVVAPVTLVAIGPGKDQIELFWAMGQISNLD